MDMRMCQPFGDVLVSVTGLRCTVEEVVWEVLERGSCRAVIKDVTVFSFIMDCCRWGLYQEVHSAHFCSRRILC